MKSIKIFFLLALATILTACSAQIRENGKIFHAGPLNSGFSAIFFALFKGHEYQFCDGDFMDASCYSGSYGLSGDTITLLNLRKHDGIPTNRFLIRRYKDMDSTYWQWKCADHGIQWQDQQQSDLRNSATGDIFPLDQQGQMVFSKNNYFLIRLDSLKKNG